MMSYLNTLNIPVHIRQRNINSRVYARISNLIVLNKAKIFYSIFLLKLTIFRLVKLQIVEKEKYFLLVFIDLIYKVSNLILKFGLNTIIDYI